MYRTFFKRLLDISLSGCAIVILSPLLLIIAVAIKIDDPGPVLFRQKRVGIHKTHFSIMKFRTMKMDTPKDTPTHLLENPEQYITKVGKFLRKSSLDELPIDVKARLDGEYVEKLSFFFDCKCFFGTIVSVLKHDGVVEGGTGRLEKEKKG